MYKNVFDNHLQNNKIFNSYMFWGQSDFLVEYYSNLVSTKLANQEDITKVYFDEYNFEYCLNIVSQSSLFSPVNILLIKTYKKIAKKELDQLIEATVSNQDSHIIFCCLGDTDYKTMAKSFTTKNNSAEVRFFSPNFSEAINILYKYAQKKQIVFEQGALEHLYEMHEKDLALCVSDIDKLSILDETISTKTITLHCFGMGSVSLDDFFINFFQGKHFKKDLYKLLEEGINEIYFINQMTSFVQQLFTINSYLKLYGELNIKEIWGYALPKPIAHKRADVAVLYNQESLNHILEQLLTLELELKTLKFTDTNGYIQSVLRNISAKLR